MDISARIEQLRETRNIRKADMAKLLDMDPSQYNKFEKRDKKLSIEQLEKIADALGVTIIDLFTDEVEQTGDSDQVARLRQRINELEEDKKIQSDFISGFKQNLTEMLNMEFLFTAFDLGLYDEKEEKITDELEVSRNFFRDGIIKYLFNSKLVEEKSPIYGQFLKWREFQEGQNKLVTSMFSGIGKRTPNETSMKKEINQRHFDEKRRKQ